MVTTCVPLRMHGEAYTPYDLLLLLKHSILRGHVNQIEDKYFVDFLILNFVFPHVSSLFMPYCGRVQHRLQNIFL